MKGEIIWNLYHLYFFLVRISTAMDEKLIKPIKAITTTSTETSKVSKTSIEEKLVKSQEFDDMLETLGSFGPYQMRLLVLIFMPVSFFAAFTVSRPS